MDDEQIELEQVQETDQADELKAKLDRTNKKLSEAIQTKKNWRDKAVDPETGKMWSEIAKPSSNPSHQPQKPAQGAQDEERPEMESRMKKLELAEQKRQFGHARGLTPEETDHLFSYAQGMGNKPEEALESPFFKTALSALRDTQKTADGIPRPSNRVPVIQGKSFDEMSDAERSKNWGKVVEGFQKK